MQEIEKLKAHIATLEMQQKGLEDAVVQLAFVLCAHARLDIAAAAQSLKRLTAAHKDAYAQERPPDFYAPAERIAAALSAASKVIQAAKGN